MRILVTGGAGFIGSHVVEHLIDAGHTVAIVDDLSSGARANIHPSATFYEVDICSERIESVFDEFQPEIVDHHAAQMNVTRSVREPLFDGQVNVLGLVRLLELSVKHSVKKFIFASTGGAIYGATKDYPATESTIPEPMSPYAVSKFAGEEYIRMYTRVYGLKHVILRYTNVFGPRQSPHGECGVCAILTDLMLEGKQPTLYGFGNPIRDYVYVGDVAKANVLALNSGENLVLNICSGKPSTVTEIFNALKTAIGFHGEPILKSIRPGEVERSLGSNERAKEILGWRPTVDLMEGLQHTIDSLRR